MSRVRNVVDRASGYIARPTKVSSTSINVDGNVLTIPNPVAELKTAKQSEITQAFDSSVTALTTAMPHEMVSWRKQEDEARAWNIDNVSSTPFIDAQLVTRNLGETKQELVDKIIANADAYAVMYAGLLGKYQNLASQIKVATTVADLELILW